MKIAVEKEDLMILKQKQILVFAIGIILLAFSLWALIKPTPKFPSWGGLLILIISFLVILGNKSTTITLDKSENKAIITSRYLLKKKAEKYDLKKIKNIELETLTPSFVDFFSTAFNCC